MWGNWRREIFIAEKKNWKITNDYYGNSSFLSSFLFTPWKEMNAAQTFFFFFFELNSRMCGWLYCIYFFINLACGVPNSAGKERRKSFNMNFKLIYSSKVFSSKCECEYVYMRARIFDKIFLNFQQFFNQFSSTWIKKLFLIFMLRTE